MVEAVSADDIRRAHERKAAALADRISEPTRRYTPEELAALVKAARESGDMPTVERAAIDSNKVLEWWHGW